MTADSGSGPLLTASLAPVKRSVTPIASVVLPAHNEEKVIERCLRSITRNMQPGELELIVVCNGCTDKTAAIAKSFKHHAQVVEIDAANKCQAINRGDAQAHYFPRIYVDADVEITIDSIRKIAAVLKQGHILTASPKMSIVFDHHTWPVKAFYRIWQELPYYTHTPIGCGVYALSEAGRKSFHTFPQLLAEDEYIRLQFTPQQRTIVTDATFKMRPPANLGMLIKIRARQQNGHLQFRRSYTNLHRTDQRKYARHLGRIFIRPNLWPSFMLYSTVHVITRTMGWWRSREDAPTRSWDRDDKNRSLHPSR